MHGGCHCCHSETVSFARDVPCECSISEGLAIVPPTRHQFLTKRGQFNGCLHAHLHENVLATENPENRRAYSSAFSLKFDILESFCVFLRWGLTYIWYVLWGKLSFKCLSTVHAEVGIMLPSTGLDTVQDAIWTHLYGSLPHPHVHIYLHTKKINVL